MPKMGVLVVGQSPRPEVEAEFRRLLPDVELEQKGCLDGLSREQIEQLRPKDGETELFTRLPNGEGVRLSKKSVVHHGTRQLDTLERSGAQYVALLCTGEFPDWSDRPILFPSNILRHLVFGLQPSGHLGILSPLAEQSEAARHRWARYGHRITNVALSPNAGADDVRETGLELAAASPDLIVYDCISYTQQTKSAINIIADRPAVLAITAVARVAAELFDNG